MKILILGHGEHGKTTFAKMIADALGVSFVSSSYAALEAIWPALSSITGVTDKDLAFRERHIYRMLWKSLISLYNAHDKSALTQRILAQHDIYEGMRALDEYQASRHLFDVVFYVDASQRLSNSPNLVDPSMAIPFDEFSMWYVSNNGDQALLRQVADHCANQLLQHDYTLPGRLKAPCPTLGDVTVKVRSGEVVTPREMRMAIAAYDVLTSHVSLHTDMVRLQEYFRATTVPMDQYLGEANDPDDPGAQEWFKVFSKIQPPPKEEQEQCAT